MLRHKGDIITFLLIFTTFLFFVFTPGKENLGPAVQGFILALIFFGLLPVGYHFLVLKRDSASFGLSFENWKNNWLLIIPTLVVSLAVTIGLFLAVTAFREALLLPTVVEKSLASFAFYELILVPLTVLLFELFFRGLVQKSWLEKHFGWYAIFAQSALFILFLVMTASLTWVSAPFVLFSVFSGYLVWKNGSLIQAWIAQWLYLLLFDIFILFMR